MEFDIWLLLAGIGILIFGMHVFEHAIKFLGGNKLKGILQKYTKSAFSSITSGAGVTALLQSSSLVSLLVLAFTGAGVMSLMNAIGVIIGANIGTTVSSLIIAAVGFGEFKISAFALPIIAIGGCALIFVKDKKWVNWAKLLVGFGLLFLGLDFMKESVDAIKASFDLEAYKHLSLWAFGFLGMIVTVIIQSSSAVGVMTLAALSSGIITFPASIAIVMGSNIGTTVTGVIASLGGETIKRQVALSQVLFNVISGIIGVVFFWQYITLTMDWLGFADNPVMGNAVLNSIFNVSTAVLFGFFLKPFTKLVEKIIPNKKSEETTLRIKQVGKNPSDPSFAQASLYALEHDTKTLIDEALRYNIYVFGLIHDQIKEGSPVLTVDDGSLHDRDKEHHKSIYEQTRAMGNTMYERLIHIKSLLENKDASESANRIDSAISNVFRSLKSTKNIYHDVQTLRDSSDPAMKELYKTLFDYAYSVYHHIATITDRDFTTENFEQLALATKALQGFHQQFITQLTEISDVKKDTEIVLSVLINIDHYVHQAATTLVNAVQSTYLSSHEEKAFEQISA